MFNRYLGLNESSRQRTGAMNDGIVSHRKDLGPLGDLLLLACPPSADGTKSIPILAAAIGYSAPGIYKWIAAERMTWDGAKKVIEVAEGRVTREQLLPYVLV